MLFFLYVNTGETSTPTTQPTPSRRENKRSIPYSFTKHKSGQKRLYPGGPEEVV